MLLILSLALLPLGLIAVFASRESAQVNRLRQEGVARALATASAVSIADSMRPALFGLRQAIDDIAPDRVDAPAPSRQCALRLAGLMQENHSASGFAMFDPRGRRVCATSGYSGLRASPAQDSLGYVVMLAARERLVRASLVGSGSGYLGIVEFPADRILDFASLPERSRTGLVLTQGSQRVRLSPPRLAGPLDELIRVATPVAGGQLGLELEMPANPVSALEILLILLPILMWAAGALIGWLVVDRLILNPLGQMQRAVALFRAGAGPLVIPRLRTPAHELAELGESFAQATEALTRHEKDLAEGLARQKRLTREVHHRVKNNLQVISSLINFHARGAATPEVGEAYASIQRRVDALALVHRHHYAEAEHNPGIPLRTLIGEISSNLRSSFAGERDRAEIRLDLASASVSQDVAIPVAFLVTEIVELALARAADAKIRIRISLLPERPGFAALRVESPALRTPERQQTKTMSDQPRFERIVNGLARQLRSALRHEPHTGSYEIEVTTIEALILAESEETRGED